MFKAFVDQAKVLLVYLRAQHNSCLGKMLAFVRFEGKNIALRKRMTDVVEESIAIS
jgi:hypothetical protein